MKKWTATILILILLTSFAIAAGEGTDSVEVSNTQTPFFYRVAFLLSSKEHWTAVSSGDWNDTLISSEWVVFGDDSGEVYMRKEDSNDLYRVFLQVDPNTLEPLLVMIYLGQDGALMVYSGTYQ